MQWELSSDVMTSGSDMYQYYQRLGSSKIVLTFRGAMSQETLVELGDLLLLPDSDSPKTSDVKKLFAIMVEMAQNILYYSSERQYVPHLDRDVGVGMIVMQQTDSAFILGCGNFMLSTRVPGVEEKCRHINSLDRDQLREYYSKERKRARTDDTAGAGLGLIDIARRAGNPLIYSFYKIDDDHSFFSLSVQVDKVHPSKG